MRRIFKLGPCLCAVVVLAAGALPAAGAPDAPTRVGVSQVYGRLPLSFEANEGQVEGAVNFLCRGHTYTLFLTPTEAVLNLTGALRETTVVRMQLAGGKRDPHVVGLDLQPTKSNYFLGNDPRQWHTGVANFARVRVEDVYPGVDLVYRGNQRQLEYDFVIAPGADPGRIRLVFRGADPITIGAQGELILHTVNGALVQHAPAVYQEAGGERQRVEGHYVVLPARATNGADGGASRQVGFVVGRYDRARSLIIDPVLVYSTYLGGSGTDHGNGIAVDGSGNAYVTGQTDSTTFPGVNGSPAAIQPIPIQRANGGGQDAFVIKIDPTGTKIVYSTFLGGSGDDQPLGIAIDGAGNAYVTGRTTSTNFPVFPVGRAIQPAYSGGLDDAFVTKINAAGNGIVYSTYLGGNGDDLAYGIAVDRTENAYVVGFTSSINFPVFRAIQAAYGGGNFDAFVTEISATGTKILFSTYLGGSGEDDGYGIAVDGAGNAYVTGRTSSTAFPGVSAISLQPAKGSVSWDAFVTKITANDPNNPIGPTIAYSTYLGGSGGDNEGSGIAIDGAGNAYVTGRTNSTNFPGVNRSPIQQGSSIQPANGGGEDAFVTEINAAGSAIVYSTYLGGSGNDEARGIAVDGSGNAYVAGVTHGPNFPVVHAIQPVFSGSPNDAFVTKIDAAGSAIVYSTYLGGSAETEGRAIAVDGAGSAYVTGGTASTNFTGVSKSSIQPANGGASHYDAFVTKIGPQTSTCVPPPNTTMVAWYPFDETTGTLSANRATGNTGVQINGPTPIPGMVDGALSFNGANQYVESPSSIVTNIGPAGFPPSCSGGYSSCQGNFSIDTWMRVSPSGSGVMTILDKRSGTPPAIKGYYLFVLGGRLVLQLADGLGSGFSDYPSPVLTPALTDGTWHHIAVTIRRTKPARIRWYHNGISIGQKNPSDRLGSLENNSPMRIGTRTADTPLSGWFRGDLDELEIYNRVLTPQEVASIFSAGTAGKCR